MATTLARGQLRSVQPKVARSRAGNKSRSMRLQVFASAKYNITLKTPGGEQTIQVAADEYILDAAEAQGIDLPFSCRSGTCCTCTGKVETGAPVDQSDQQFLDEDQVKAGFALLCVSYATGDAVVSTHQENNL